MRQDKKKGKENNPKKKYILSLVLSFFCLFSLVDIASAGTGSMHGWAWSDNIGWVSFNCDNDYRCSTNDNDYGVIIGEDSVLTGYAWSDNLGWISFNSSELVGCPSGACNARLVNGKIVGWAKQINDSETGWIKLGPIDVEGIDYGVTVTGEDVTGWAWSDVFGWLSFNCTNDNSCATSNYAVTYEPPDVIVGNLSTDIRYCAHDSLVTVNDGLAVIFSWDFTSRYPQKSYEFELATDSAFTNPFYTTAETSSSSYVLNLGGSDWNEERLDWGSTYYWRVRATNLEGNMSSWVEGLFTISNDHGSPRVVIEHDPEKILAGRPITFNGSGSEVYDGSTPTYHWTFEGGDPATSTESTETVTFEEGSDFTTTLTVTDGSGYSCQKTHSNTVNLFSPIWKDISPF